MRSSNLARPNRLALAVAIGVAVWAAETFRSSARAAVRTTTTCAGASPFDTVPDEIALQACLDHYDDVLLEADGARGYVGYIVNDTLKLKRTGGLLSSTASPRKALILAGRDLSSSMLRASSIDDFEISFIRFDGNRENRAVRDKPCDAGHNFRNVELTGNGFRVRYVESHGAVCGSAMTIGGSTNFEVYGSWFYDNGRQPEEANGISGLWADGLTVFRCPGSTIRDNHFWDNTDVDLGVNGGPSCSVYRNTITHTSKYAFAGLVVGDPTNRGGEFSANVVSSGYNLLGFGIIVGCHPWNQCGGGYASNVNVYDNTSTGAVVNLAVDGLNGGSVQNNRVSFAQGNRVMNCVTSADYAVGHMLNARVQSGFVIRFFDFGSDCRQP